MKIHDIINEANWLDLAKVAGLDAERTAAGDLASTAARTATATLNKPMLYFFNDIGRGGRSFTRQQLLDLGLKPAENGSWYIYSETPDRARELQQTLNVYAKAVVPKTPPPPAKPKLVKPYDPERYKNVRKPYNDD